MIITAFFLAIYARVRLWFFNRRALTIIAWHHYALRRRRFESDASLRQRCVDRVDSLRP